MRIPPDLPTAREATPMDNNNRRKRPTNRPPPTACCHQIHKRLPQVLDLCSSRMAESGRVAGSAPADPDPESGQTRPESGGVGLSRPVCSTTNI
ncbi:hypothetical protein Taro_027875 [Colocasia esculenta]|uniref:Uncharacterized protein n=1 Tax=Colocasia esculenta TaxID=4460 RepID=A0A843V9U6_COLES|nr:hypothetical protein [Colocasia esculenta]